MKTIVFGLNTTAELVVRRRTRERRERIAMNNDDDAREIPLAPVGREGQGEAATGEIAGRRVHAPLATVDQDRCSGQGEGGKVFQVVAADVRRLKLTQP